MKERFTKLYILFLIPLGLVAAICAALLYQVWEESSALGLAGVSVVCFALVIRRYLRWVDEIKTTAASSETAERFRAEQAETHLEELQHYVKELERSSSALRESRESFRHAAYHDSLTGLANRNKIMELLKPCFDRVRKEGQEAQKFAILFLDLNRFKTVNDSLGHSFGDKLIIEVGQRLTTFVGEEGTVGRLSGDEFVILLPKIDSEVMAVEVAELASSVISQAFELEERQIFLGVSIGIAIGSSRYMTAEELLRDADIAMYFAKETNQEHVVFDQIMHARAVSLLDLETDLRMAVERSEFELYYQPVVSLDDVGLVGFEALVRWNHPSRGLITPDEFISVAESTGLMIPMTIQTLRAACAQSAIWKEAGLTDTPLMISVNLSASHLLRDGIVDQLRTIIFETGVDAEHLKLEITESAVMQNAETAISVLKKIKDLGVRISIDDFGTGYSSLSYLHRLPIDTLKIDRSFVSTMEDGSENGEIVRTVIALAKALKLGVIAEGIESIHQFHQLRILGCEYGQGYLFSRPVPTAEAEKILADVNRWRNILPINDFGVIARNQEYTHMRIQ